MQREEIRNKVFAFFKRQSQWVKDNPNKVQQFQLSSITGEFPYAQNEPQWATDKVHSVVREIVQELINNGFIYPGTATGYDGFPWLTVTEYGLEAFMTEDWLPYDPEGYLRELKNKVPDIDNITFAYISESAKTYYRRDLLSATITLGVAAESLMLDLIDCYAEWLPSPRKEAFLKKITGRFISPQFSEFKREILNDVKILPKDLTNNYETYLDGIFNFIRLNRNDAGHPTGKQVNAKTIYANLQIFAEYADLIIKLTKYFRNKAKV